MSNIEETAPDCPYLGLVDDSASHYSFAEPKHRCWSRHKLTGIDLAFQTQVCLGGDYKSCAKFVTATRPLPLATEPPVAIQASSGRRSSRAIGTVGSAVVLVIVAGILVASLYMAGRFAGTAQVSPPGSAIAAVSESSPSTSPTVEVSPTVLPVPTPSSVPAVATMTPTPTTPPSTASATPVLPTPSPVPSPTIYVVQRGDTLIRIATEYGVRLLDLAAANGIDKRDQIHIGQLLVIP